MITNDPNEAAQNTLDNLNSQLAQDQANLKSVQGQIQTQLSDPTWLKYTAILTKLGGNTRSWISSDGSMWTANDAAAENASARQYVQNWTTTYNSMRNQEDAALTAVSTDKQAISDFYNTPAGKTLAGAVATEAQTGLTNAQSNQIAASAAANQKKATTTVILIVVGVAALALLIWWSVKEYRKAKMPAAA